MACTQNSVSVLVSACIVIVDCLHNGSHSPSPFTSLPRLFPVPLICWLFSLTTVGTRPLLDALFLGFTRISPGSVLHLHCWVRPGPPPRSLHECISGVSAHWACRCSYEIRLCHYYQQFDLTYGNVWQDHTDTIIPGLKQPPPRLVHRADNRHHRRRRDSDRIRSQADFQTDARSLGRNNIRCDSTLCERPSSRRHRANGVDSDKRVVSSSLE